MTKQMCAQVFSFQSTYKYNGALFSMFCTVMKIYLYLLLLLFSLFSSSMNPMKVCTKKLLAIILHTNTHILYCKHTCIMHTKQQSGTTNIGNSKEYANNCVLAVAMPAYCFFLLFFFCFGVGQATMIKSFLQLSIDHLAD